MTIPNGSDAVVDSLFSYQQYNRIKNHWYSATAPTAPVAGMIWVDSDDGKVYVYYGAAWVEIGGSMDYNFDNVSVGSHTGDTNWQTIIDETAEGRAQVHFSNTANEGECRITIDGGAAMTIKTLGATVPHEDFVIIDYNTSLLVEIRTSNGSSTTDYSMKWSAI